MKTTTILALSLLLTGLSFSQQGINYKAFIKDSGGNVVANQNITIQFIIYEGAALTNNVYQETHTPSTDANGIVMANIGEGTTSDVFTDIDWGADDHYLNVQIDTGGGLTDMGTTQFMAVPYAFHAFNATGLETLDDGNGNGWRLIGKIPEYYGDIGLNAVDFSENTNSSSIHGATGENAVAIGLRTIASGANSVAMGMETTASEENATALGYNTVASGWSSTAFGGGTEASGNYATAIGSGTTAAGNYSLALGRNTSALQTYSASFGYGTSASSPLSIASGLNTIASGNISTTFGSGTKAESIVSTAFGQYNLGGGNPTSFVSTDPIFEIGNGIDDANRSNALTVLKDGTLLAPSLTNTLIGTAGNKVLITKEYANTIAPTGLHSLDEGNGVGWRLIGRDPTYYGTIGLNAIDFSFNDASSTNHGAIGNYSNAFGYKTMVSGTAATGFGYESSASGYGSMATGNGTDASGNYAMATGYFTTASGDTSFSSGGLSNASGSFSMAVGIDTKAEARGSMATGLFNIGGGNPTTYIDTDPLFEIGNGIDNANRSNALTVLKNGTITAPSLTNALIETAGDKALITKEYVVANLTTKIDDLLDGKSDNDGSNNGSSIFIGIDAGLNDDISDNRNVGIGFNSLFTNTSGYSNIAIGYQSLYNNTGGHSNTANGYQSLYTNTIGQQNTANGYLSLHFNTEGYANTATGYKSLYSNTTGLYNTAFGHSALAYNTLGIGNTAIGLHALLSNTEGNRNTANGYNVLSHNTVGESNLASGYESLYNNTEGSYNTSTGGYSLFYNTLGHYNSGVGHQALYSNTTGDANTGIGCYALNANSTGNNNTAIGYDAQVPDGTLNNQVRIGNTDITYAGVQVAWDVTSDRRWKENIRELPYGLELVKQLKPVDYVRKNNDAKTRETGFIGQDVEVLLAKFGYLDQGILHKDDKGFISLRYNDFFALLTKAIQEQQEIIDNQNKKIESQEHNYETLLKRVEQIELTINQ